MESDPKKCAGNLPVKTTDPKTIVNPSKCDAAGNKPKDKDYEYEDMKKIIGDYLEKDYIYDGLQAKADAAAHDHASAKKNLDAATFSIKLVCDDKKVTFTEYDDLKCKDKPNEFKAAWGECVSYGDEGKFIKMTGAIALKAAAAALVAFAGSQF